MHIFRTGNSYFSFAKVAQASSGKYWSLTPDYGTKFLAAFLILFFTAHLNKMGYSDNFLCNSLPLHDFSLLLFSARKN